MASLSPARIAAADVLSRVRRRNARARDLLRVSAPVARLTPADRALATRFTLGAVRASGAIDALLDAHLRRSHLEPRMRDALRISALELLWLATPVPVALSQGVELVRRVSPRGAGLANAVLHRVAEEDVPALAQARKRVESGSCTTSDIALVAALPAWLAGELVVSLGIESACHMALSAMEAPGAYVAGNACLHDDDEAERLLSAAGLIPRATCLPGCLTLFSAAGLAKSGLVDAADVVPADMAAQVVAWLASPAPSTRMLEVGQGRGTKSLLLECCAQRRGGLAQLSAVELEAFKVAVSRARMERAGLGAFVTCTAFDGCRLGEQDLPQEIAGSFDSVLVDAPCSGTGTLRRHPEIAWSLQESAVHVEGRSLPELQLAMFQAASERVGAGGTLAYATCSELREEDESIVAAFLASPKGARFSLVSPRVTPAFAALPPEAQGLVATMIGDDGMLRTSRADSADLPLDGHFLALLMCAV
ncbi:RsmB/NOP family class I SAM-dependent RNA methyltransferase [Olsenella sp. Marseille-P4559]|uniref:RsmB/NOP family class I SAM-dependent RNA methyltransferase n=1 Tax=Olsenella sp. Marseille-P4559 TaxID=2364795 RepID=UPI00102F34A6|nr:transcription antitermination factor NusB [Olsenella sp. Marseille-P4559]